MSTLLPCPFCGGEAVDPRPPDNFCGYSFAECSEPGCDVAGPDGETISEAAHRWNTRPIESALRSRVEELEGALERADLFLEQTANALEEMLGDHVPEDRQREMCEGMIAAIQGYDTARAALKPDKGEPCGGTGRRLRPEPVHSPALLASWSDEPCPGCPDCREERCETCGGSGEIEDRWLEPTHHPFCDGSCAQGCPVPAERHEHAPCPGCKEDVR